MMSMEALLNGVKSHWNNSPVLRNKFAGGIHLRVAPNHSEYPYVIVTCAENPFFTFTEFHADYTVGLTVHAKSPSAEDGIFTYASYVTEWFDEERFDVDAHNNLLFRRELISTPTEVDEHWALVLQYHCILRRCLT